MRIKAVRVDASGKVINSNGIRQAKRLAKDKVVEIYASRAAFDAANKK